MMGHIDDLEFKKYEVSARLHFTQGCFLPRIYRNLLDNWTPGMCLQYAIWFLWKTGKKSDTTSREAYLRNRGVMETKVDGLRYAGGGV